jgi:hypothetical protein
VVDVESIYRFYSAGSADPNAISAAIRRAKSLGTTHVLLVGGDTYDYFNVLGINSVSFIPTHYRRTDDIIAYAPADSVYADTDNNGSPDLALGRWPVRTNAELQNIISKTLRYQNRNKAVLLNDRTLAGVSFDQSAAPLASMLSTSFSSDVISLDSYASGNASTARADLISRMQSGASLLTYFGHSAPSSWSREGLVTANQVYGGLFSPVSQSFAAVQYGCWATYFVEPTSSTVAHGLLLRPEGAAIVMGATSLTQTNSDINFANQLMPKLGNQGFGQAFQQSIQAISNDPSNKDVVIGGAILGDPALGE